MDRRMMLAGGALLSAAPIGARASGRAEAEPIGVVARPAPAPQREGAAPVEGGELYYWDTGGSGPAIVLLHAATGSAHCWEYQQPVFAKAGYRVIGYSRRGYRGSSALDAGRPGTATGDLAALADHLGIERPHLVATAAGAFVAASFAIEFPHRVASLTLACTMLGVRDAEIERLIANVGLDAIARLPADLRELGPSYRAIDPEGHARWNALHEAAFAGRTPRQPRGAEVTGEALRGLTMPVLLVSGEADLYAPPPLARAFQRIMPGTELAVVREAGHSVYWERPDLFNAAVLDFIGRHR